MLRNGMPATAKALAAATPGMHQLTDLHIFEGAQAVLDGFARCAWAPLHPHPT